MRSLSIREARGLRKGAGKLVMLAGFAEVWRGGGSTGLLGADHRRKHCGDVGEGAGSHSDVTHHLLAVGHIETGWMEGWTMEANVVWVDERG